MPLSPELGEIQGKIRRLSRPHRFPEQRMGSLGNEFNGRMEALDAKIEGLAREIRIPTELRERLVAIGAKLGILR